MRLIIIIWLFYLVLVQTTKKKIKKKILDNIILTKCIKYQLVKLWISFSVCVCVCVGTTRLYTCPWA